MEPISEIVEFKNWAVRCVRPDPAQPKTCSLFQRLNTDQGQTVMTVSVVFADNDSSKDATIVFALPLGLALQPGLTLDVDGLDPKVLNYSHCNNNGCFASQILDDIRRGSFEMGKVLNVRFNTLQNQTVNIPASLYGFTAGYATLIEKVGQ